jgi:3-deoxy-D-manno-octulosonic-acid transferase
VGEWAEVQTPFLESSIWKAASQVNVVDDSYSTVLFSLVGFGCHRPLEAAYIEVMPALVDSKLNQAPMIFSAKIRKQEHTQAPKQQILQKRIHIFRKNNMQDQNYLLFFFHIIPAHTEDTHGSL